MNARPNQPQSQVAVVAESRTVLGALLTRLGPDAVAALADGRVFVGKQRASSADQAVEPGQEVVVHARRRAEGADAEVALLGERSGIVAVAKPAPLASVPDLHGRTGSLTEVLVKLAGSRARRWEPTSRLDVGVSGVVLFAATPAARAWLVRAREQGEYRRHYVAIAARAPTPARGTWDAPIGRGSNPLLRTVGGRDARAAATRYAVAAETPRAALLAVEPQTGRTHQIRVHAAHAGAPLFGDPAYGGAARLVQPNGAVVAVRRIALHAAWVDVPLPSETQRWHVQAPIDPVLATLWDQLGGTAPAWQTALEPC